MRFKIITPILILLLLCGCSYIEPEAVFTVTAVGGERKSGVARMLIQVADNDGDETGFKIFEGRGASWSEALSDIHTRLSKKTSFSHCRIIAVSSDIGRAGLGEFLELCLSEDISLHCPVVCANKVGNLFGEEKYLSGAELSSLIRENASYFGFGGHSALFEIKTALIVSADKFALPILETEQGGVKVKGLCYFSNGIDHAAIFSKRDDGYDEG